MPVQRMSSKKIIKAIIVNLDKCIGCRACEMACSGFHAKPRYSSTNPSRSRIRVIVDESNNEFVPIRAGDYTKTECASRNTYTINGKEYSQCSFCGDSCPSRDLFKEPDSGLPLKCDMCESNPPIAEPMCVQVCRCDALTYTEREEEEVKKQQLGSLESGLSSLANKHGIQKVIDAFAQLSKQD